MMEKQFKPVPDVECLKYHGTPEKPDIKIFVSHRIDQDSETIDNPLYIPVRCGAVYDDREGITMLGDDTGDNISEKRMSYCELTVQYWAWKNVKADYYGLCHYRRYLSFANETYTENLDTYNHVVEPTISDKFAKKFGISEERIRRMVSGQDVISIIPLDLHETKEFNSATVYESLKRNPTVFVIDYVDEFIKVFKEKHPEYAFDIDEYFSGKIWRAFNCYVLRKELFFEYNSLLFDVLFELEKRIDLSLCNREQLRFLGYMGEILFAIFYNYLKRTRKINSKEVQLVRIENAEKSMELHHAFQENSVPIVVACSNEYVSFLATLIKSIEINSSETNNYDIIVLENQIRRENKELLKDMISGRKNFSIRFVNATKYLVGRNFHTAMHITPMTYLRLAVLDIVSRYEKVIYLDCDIVVNTDIAELYNTDIDGYLIGAALDTVMAGWCNVKDNPQAEYNEKVVGLKEKFSYFNAGVILINIKEFKKDYTTEELMSIASSRKWKWFDQDVLNHVCAGRVLYLDNSWNVMSHQHDFDYQMAEYYAPEHIFANYKKALEHPKIIHYAGRFIPCFVPTVDLAVYFWKYARETPYYELILSGMVANQIGLYHSNSKGSKVRRIGDFLLPKGSRRRAFAKRILPKGSRRWNFCKKIYYKLGGK